MPSRLVDEAWHALILDSLAYVQLCGKAFGTYLHHFPETGSDREEEAEWSALVNTVWAWDRSDAGREHESLLWDLDERHDVEDTWGISEYRLTAIRSKRYADGGEGWPIGIGADRPPDSAAGGGGAGDGADGGGGGCGGGGCGGGS